MQKIILTLLALSFSFVLQAQTPTINWNTPLDKKEQKKASRGFLGSTQEHYYLISNPKSGRTILQYDLNHQLLNTIPLNSQKGAFGYLKDLLLLINF